MCNICINAKKDNIFTTGKVDKVPKKDDFTKHEKGGPHRSAVEAMQQRKAFKTAAVKAHDGAKGAIHSQMATLLTQAKECIPVAKNRALVALQIHNGIQNMQPMVSDSGQAHYLHWESLMDLYNAMHEVVVENIHEELKSTPYKYFGIEIDEATDCSSASIVISPEVC